MRKNGVRCLLMGGQACVSYGAAEFSRDLDLVIFLDDVNLDRLRRAFADLDAARSPRQAIRAALHRDRPDIEASLETEQQAE
jgi:hypothetical protein